MQVEEDGNEDNGMRFKLLWQSYGNGARLFFDEDLVQLGNSVPRALWIELRDDFSDGGGVEHRSPLMSGYWGAENLSSASLRT